MKSPRELRDRVVVITGAASGIGAATARLLADQGVALVLTDIADQALERQRRLVGTKTRVITVPSDVTDRSSLERLLIQSCKAWGRVDALVNCAGVLRPGAVADTSEEAIRHEVDVNVMGTVNTTQIFLPYFLQEQRGHLVHIASLGGIVPLPYGASYSATKFAVRGFTLALALELRRTPIKVSVVCPDSTDTPQLVDEALGEGSSLSFTSKLLMPTEVARAIVRTLYRPKLEVLVPAGRGWLVRLGGASPGLLRLLYPALDRWGTRGRRRYIQALRRRSATAVAN